MLITPVRSERGDSMTYDSSPPCCAGRGRSACGAVRPRVIGEIESAS
ncbi:hypothetical protein [Streptomyces sp. NBRC 110028]|nr:hypothetical protein [Streptomyces sp. NBRC 110028]